ncbi:tyrosine-protein phosphatase non-receptor type 13 isoform X6 [Astyanax mexicanus]|uniref:tyrosine-protein phosphatase non-receptor type 13 isoform X6 n=1 Tax=Astyanax mexicanus TaxID=7994 RepID=UPI0020CB2864|nr:tyrosine-protein phosphatase non-receptor type 13 isoform X6 [Astyanax mexicanus]
MHVSLAEALEVRGGPLQEEEVWAVLSQSADSLHELMRTDPAALGFIISPWSLLLMPSGNISFTDENVTQQDLRAFTSPEILEGLNLSSVADIEKMHVYSLGMTLFWGADYKIPQSQPMTLSEHLNSVLLKMCEDSTLSRLSVRSILNTCSTHIRNSTCDPAFSYIRKLVRLVLGSLSQLDGLLSQTEKESLPERSKEIRDRLRGKGLPAGRSAAHRVLERYRARTQDQAALNRGLSRSMGSLPIQGALQVDESTPQDPLSEYGPGSETSSEPYTQQQARGRPMDTDRRSLPHHRNKNWASSVDLACLDPDVLRFGALEDARRGSTALSTHSVGRPRSAVKAWEGRYPEFSSLEAKKAHHQSAHSVSGAYNKFRERHRKLHALSQAMDDPMHTQQSYHSDYSSSSESPSVTSSDPDYKHARRSEEIRRFSSQVGLSETDGALFSGGQRHRLYDRGQEELSGAELLVHRQEEEIRRLQARLSRASFPPFDDRRTSIADLREPLRSNPLNTSSLQPLKAKNVFGPEFVKMASEPQVVLNVPASIMNKRGKVEESQRKVGVVLLNGQKLEVSCDVKVLCKDVLDMVIAHVGLVEHHLFGLAFLRDDEFFFIDSDTKLLKVAPDGWKEDPKKKKTDVNFNLFLRIRFFHDDVNFIQHFMTKHQYYLQLRKDVLEERLRCDMENAMLLASLALQAEFGDYQAELHGKTYFRMEHYLPAYVMDKLDQSSIKEELSKLHSTYYGAKEEEAEFEFLKVSQRLTEYGVHFHRVLPEKRSQTGILLGVNSKGVLIFELLNGNRTPVLRFPWRDTKKISFTKKKICLQNTSDGIKHQFQTDSQKTCQYLLHQCSAQHKFHLHLKTRQSNQELQEIENSPLSNLQYPAGLDSLDRTISVASLALSTPGSRSDSDPLKLINSELALTRGVPARLSIPEESSFPGFNSTSNPRLKSRSHHNLGQVPESPEHRAVPFSSQSQSNTVRSLSLTQSHQRASSDTDSITISRQPEGSVGDGASWSPKSQREESDSSSCEESGQAYVKDSLRKKLNSLPSPEREIKSVNLKTDVKYGLGFEISGGENSGRIDLGPIISSITPGGPADVDSCLKPGDRLLSVNDVSLEGVPYEKAVEILQSAPDDITLVVSQPKERLFPEEQTASPSPSPPPFASSSKNGISHAMPMGQWQESLSSQDSKSDQSSLALLHVNGFHQKLPEEILAAQSSPNEHEQTADVTPPALPPKTRKTKSPEVPLELEHSDRGDSDMDEDTYSSSQEKPKKEVISALRGTAQEVTLKLCRPEVGVLPKMDFSSQTPMASLRKEPPPKPHFAPDTASPPQAEKVLGPVEQVLERLLMKSPSRRDSYSDSTDDEEDEDVEEAFSPASMEQASLNWDHSVYQTPRANLPQGRPGHYDSPSELDDSIHSAYYSSSQSASRKENEKRPPSLSPLLSELKSSPALSGRAFLNPSPDPLPPPLPLPINTTLPEHQPEMEDFLPEVELKVSLVKSDKGSLGFTLTKGNDHNCYIHDIIQDPAKGDGRLRPGDRMIMVNNTDVSGMTHTEVVNLVRAAPRVVDLMVGRVLEPPKPPIEAHLLPDITFQCPSDSLGLVLDGGRDSDLGVLYVKDIVPGSAAASEGSLKQLDLIHYINGAPTQDLTLSESHRLLELALRELTLKATRDGKPVCPEKERISILNNNVSPKDNYSSSMNGYLHSNDDDLEALCPPEEQVIQLQLEKPPSGGLGFSVIGGERGIFVKSVTPGGMAHAEGTLQVGDRLLKVNNELMTSVSHTKAVTSIRKTKGMVYLVVSRPPDQTPSTYLGFMPLNSTYNGNMDVSEDSGVKTKLHSSPDACHSKSLPSLPPIDYDTTSLDRQKRLDPDVSEDTDCDGSSLPEDSPETSRKAAWKEENVDNPQNDSYLLLSGQLDEDEITWGSEELPIDDINYKFTQDGLIITEEELTSLPLVKVVPEGQYTGPKLNSVVRMMRGLLEQKIPLQEFENLQNLQPLDDCLIGQMQENKKKNRYKNIVPFDTTRVVLGKDGGYINANFIKMLVKDESFHYIACQGPLPTTLGDFWQMVWEQKSNVIAMMTQEVEGGKVKCQRYWPDASHTAEMVGERLQITLIKDQHLENFVIRLIEVKDIQTNEIQRVTHLNYTGWPDHGTPTQPEQLLTFISYMRHIHQSGPIITHCSAGIGRSGTLICIDVVLGLISKDADFDISDVVRSMRLQRQGMVQTEEQYIFCYQVILYVLRCLQAEEKISG